MAAKVGIESRRVTKAGRMYQILPPPEPAYPSVTTVEEIIAKQALYQWYAKREREACKTAAADMFEEWQGPLKVTNTITRDVYCSLLEARIGKKKAGTKELEAAGEIGSQTHEMIEWYIGGLLGQPQGPQPKLKDAALWAFMAFEDWAKSVSLLPIRSEQVVFSHQYKYAGTMDLLAYFGSKRKILLADFKTGKAIYPEAFMQLAAYRHALVEMKLETVDECWVIRLPKVETDPQFEARQVTDLDAHFKAFLAARELWDWNYKQNHKEE